MQYTVDYFLWKFGQIPEDQWCERHFRDAMGRHCALGHCGSKEIDNNPNLYEQHTREGRALMKLFHDAKIGSVASINDFGAFSFAKYTTPKQRILAALRYIKKQEV